MLNLFKPLPFLLTLFLFCGALTANAQGADRILQSLPAATNTLPGQANEEPSRHVSIRLVPSQTFVRQRDTINIAIEQTIEPGWHTYWKNPGDSGEPMAIKWTLPRGFSLGKLRWPTPEKIMIGPLASYGYQDKAILLQEVVFPDVPLKEPVTLKAEISWLVCEEICIPESATFEIPLDNEFNEIDNTDFITEAFGSIPYEYEWQSRFWSQGDDLVIEVKGDQYDVAPPLGGILSGMKMLSFIPEDWGIVDNTAATSYEIEGDTLTLRQKRGDRPLDKLETISGLVSFRDTSGFLQSFRVTATANVKKAQVTATSPVTTGNDGKTEALSLPLILLYAVLGGLILNLMPCVFPILSLKALKLCRMSGKELAEARKHGWLYTGGILLSFTGFALVIIALRAAGEQIGWGFQLQNPLAVLLLSWLLFVIGLNLSGFFEFGGALAGTGSKLTQGQSYSASFFTGILAAIVATPCTAPFMGVAMGVALTLPVALTLLIFSALGFGLALPYLLLTYVPGLHGKLPKPGPWMETLKKLLALPLYASVIWLLWVYSQQVPPILVALAIVGLISLALTLWLWKQENKTLHRLAFVALLVGVIPAAGMSRGVQPPATVTGQKDHWVAYQEEKFNTMLNDYDQALFVNMTAAWCITCKVNEKLALDTGEAKQAFEDGNVVTIKGDWTNRNAEITRFLQSYGRSGVPLYVYYGPRDETGRRPDPVVLPQILSPGIIKATISKTEVKS